jgi:hypothetical protein
MRTICQAILLVILTCRVTAAQTIATDFKIEGAKKPGEQVTIKGAEMDKVTSVALRPEGKPDGKSDLAIQKFDKKPDKSEISFAVPDTANGKYTVIVTPPGNTSIPLTVTPEPKTPPSTGSAATATPTPSPTPVIESVFPTTTFPVQSRFDFEINGQNFSPDPQKDDIEVEGQGLIRFGPLRYQSKAPDIKSEITREAESACKQAASKNSLNKYYPCLGVTDDGRRLVIFGFERRNEYQGPMRVKVVVNNVSSGISGYFTLSRVDARIVLWLSIVFFGLLMYIVYRLVSKGVQGFTVAGQKYGPLAAFLIDKTTDSYSLSKFQLFALSMVAFFGYVYVFLCQVLVQWKFTFPDIPDNYPSLLAISAGTSIAAVGINSTRGTKGAGPVYPSAADFISNGGLVVPERFQFFVWTLIACIGFIALILMQDPATVSGFPNFPTGLLYVMGVSASGYLGGKAVRTAGPILKEVQVESIAAAPPAPGAPPDLKVILKGDNLDKQGRFRIDGANQSVVGTVDGDAQPQGTTGYCTRLAFTLSQAGGFAKGDHTFEIINRDGVGAQAIFTATPMKSTGPAATINHGKTETVTLTIENYREGSSARWLAPGGSAPVEIAAAEVKKVTTPAPPAGASTVTVSVPAGDKTGTGTLTLVSQLGGTEAISVTVI